MDRRILATCSGILEKFVFVSTKNGLNWCEHVRDISFEPFTSTTIERRKKCFNHHSFLKPNMFVLNSSEKDGPKNISDITLFATANISNSAIGLFEWSALSIAKLHENT